ncbi:MAG TPA: XdhC family protein, partial [Candidatus Baltobacteraceae bacterium]|nr:XdhC family protein [Candidatus Baltobacteraceae bacterium]
MRAVYAAIADRLRSGTPFAVATLVAVRDAAPAPLGTSLIVDADGSFVGNIGAGCHEAEVVEAARAASADRLETTLTFSLTDELLDGSSCGASLDVVVWLPDASFADVADRIVTGDETVIFTCGERTVTIGPRRRAVVVGATDLG